jgi:hypothetical protein
VAVCCGSYADVLMADMTLFCARPFFILCSSQWIYTDSPRQFLG